MYHPLGGWNFRNSEMLCFKFLKCFEDISVIKGSRATHFCAPPLPHALCLKFWCITVCTVQTLVTLVNTFYLSIGWGGKRKKQGHKEESRGGERCWCYSAWGKDSSSVRLFIDKHIQTIYLLKGYCTQTQTNTSIGFWMHAAQQAQLFNPAPAKQPSTSTGLVVLPCGNVSASHFPCQCLCLHDYAKFGSLLFQFFLSHHTHCCEWILQEMSQRLGNTVSLLLCRAD